jgi:hypothetical protein
MLRPSAGRLRPKSKYGLNNPEFVLGIIAIVVYTQKALTKYVITEMLYTLRARHKAGSHNGLKYFLEKRLR